MFADDRPQSRVRALLARFGCWCVRAISRAACRLYGFEMQRIPPQLENCIVMFNHPCVNDSVFSLGALPGAFTPVVGEAMLSKRRASVLLKALDPIELPQAASPLPAMRAMIRRARAGETITMCPEGFMTFDGVMRPLSPSNGELVKRCGCGLVTYRIDGGYLRNPIWARHRRRGALRGTVVGCYSSEQLTAMDGPQLARIIEQDLFYDDYALQSRQMLPYPGRAKAEGLENIIAICPECGAHGTVRTKGDSFWCAADGCTFEGEVDDYGFFAGERMPFKTMPQLERWMVPAFDEACVLRGESLLFAERPITLLSVMPSHSLRRLEEGELRVWSRRMSLGSHSFEFCDMYGAMLLYGGSQLLFRCKQGYFALDGDCFAAWKLKRVIDKAMGAALAERI